MSENNRPDSEEKKDQTTAEDILAQVDSILADLENSAVAQLFAAQEPPQSAQPPAADSSAPPGQAEIETTETPPKSAPDESGGSTQEVGEEEPVEELPAGEIIDVDGSVESVEKQPVEQDTVTSASDTPEDAEVESGPDEGQTKETAPEQTSDSDTGTSPEPEPEDGDEIESPTEDIEEPEFVPIEDKKPKKKKHRNKEKKSTAKPEAKEPPVIQSPPENTESAEETEETAGMSLIQKAQYRAKMRRREQTRLRRENARRVQEGAEVTYQPMTRLDMQSTIVRLAAAAVVLAAGFIMHDTSAALPLYLLAYIIAALPIAIRVANNFTHGTFFDEYLVVLLASLGAFILGSRAEATLVLILFDAGKIVSDKLLAATYESLPMQNNFMPEKALVVNMKGEERQVDLFDIRLGELVLVHKGERVPIDGVVLRGDGTVDDSMLTGENVPMEVSKNTRVLAGSLYNGSLMLIRVISRYEDCAVSQIRRILEESIEHKAAVETSVQKNINRIMVAVVIAAVLAAILPPLMLTGMSIELWVYRALTLLVACCPTALALTVPLTYVCGNGRLEHEGVHIKGSEAIEKTSELRMAVFNKTGTVTTGNLRIKKIYPTQEFTENDCLALAAAAEQLSQHPAARAIVNAYKEKLPKTEEFEEFPGRGVRARIGNHILLVGNRKLMVSRGVKGIPDISGTVVYIACEGEHIGVIELEDTVRSGAAEAVKELKSQGIQRTVLLTGDSELSTQRVLDAVGMDAMHCGLTPEEKESKLDFLMRTIPMDGAAAYIGDGVRDIAELKMADIGVAMGTRGSRYSAEAADILITANDLTRLGTAVRVCRNTHSIVMQNIALLLSIKLIVAVLALLGIAHMWLAIVVDVILSALTVLNAERLLSGQKDN